METMKDGTPFNPAPHCFVKTCPHPSAARLVEDADPNLRRRDLCARHALTMKRVHKNQLTVLAAWGALTLEDFDD